MHDDDEHGVFGRPEDARRSMVAWAVFLGAAATLFLGAAVLTSE